MSTDGDEDHGFQIVGAIRRQKVIVMVTTLVFVSLAIGFVAVQQRPYRSVVTLLLSPASTDDNVVVGAQEADRHVLNERNFLQSDAVEQAVTERLGYDAHITTSGTSGDDIIEVHAEIPDAALCSPAVAEAYANVYLDLRRDDLGRSSMGGPSRSMLSSLRWTVSWLHWAQTPRVTRSGAGSPIGARNSRTRLISWSCRPPRSGHQESDASFASARHKLDL